MMKTIRDLLTCWVLALMMMVPCGMYAQNSQYREMHKVKKKETIFGICRTYGITIEELIAANPEMRKPNYELKKDDIIFIPFANTDGSKGVSAIKTNVQRTVNVGVMLPLHQVDGDGKRMVEYYRGMLLAVEQLKQQGISVNMKAWNMAQDADVQKILADASSSSYDLIVGPLYTKQVQALSDFCRKGDAKMLIPFSINGDDVDRNPNIFQVYQSSDAINEATVKHFASRFANYNTVIVDCNDSTSKKSYFTGALRKQLEKAGRAVRITNVSSSDEVFAKAFSLSQPNVVVLNTGRSPELTQVIKKLTKLVTNNNGVKISLFGYTEWLLYQKANMSNFCRFDTYIPSTYYYNEVSQATNTIETRYRQAFGEDMTKAIPHFALTGYDQAMFFIGGIYKYGKQFTGARGQQYAAPVQTTYNFSKATKDGGYRNTFFQFIHYRPDGGIESIAY